MGKAYVCTYNLKQKTHTPELVYEMDVLLQMVPQEVTHAFREAQGICRNQLWERAAEPSYESHSRVSWFEHPSYSADLSLSHFCLISKIKSSIKGLVLIRQACLSGHFLSQWSMSVILASEALARPCRKAWSIFSSVLFPPLHRAVPITAASGTHCRLQNICLLFSRGFWYYIANRYSRKGRAVLDQHPPNPQQQRRPEGASKVQCFLLVDVTENSLSTFPLRCFSFWGIE